MDKAVIVNNVTKKYKLYNNTKERLLDLMTTKEYGRDFYALADVSFDIEKGDAVGFIGVNGSGKSTLSNIIAGIVPESSGDVTVNGETSLIAVAAGLKGDLTGRDNIELKCLMLGFSKEEIKDLEPEIIEFSELEEFIDQPVKSYSSGMRSRLGFAISVSVDPDIIIIDEALSVGDRAFAEKSLEKMREFKEQGKTMIFVSHSIRQIRQFCDKVLWLENGMVRDYGENDKVLPKYQMFLKQWKDKSRGERNEYRERAFKYQSAIINGTQNNLKAPWEEEESYVTGKTSQLGKISKQDAYIYLDPRNKKNKEKATQYLEHVYFIKKQAFYNNDMYYLLSRRPSADKGIIGWIKSTNVVSNKHVAVDSDPKAFKVLGNGAAYNRAWGAKENTVYQDLMSFKDWEFTVNKTEQVGEDIWYRGMLDERQVWIQSDYLDVNNN